MDIDRHDATFAVFRADASDAWFRPDEDVLLAGVYLCTHYGSFSMFPYEVAALEPFELAVAVEVRSTAIYAAIATSTADDRGDCV